jgi:hypothetical protein
MRRQAWCLRGVTTAPIISLYSQNEGAEDVCVICECSPCVCAMYSDRSKYRAPLEVRGWQAGGQAGREHD